MGDLIARNIARSFSKHAKYENGSLIIMNINQLINALNENYNTGPDSEDQRDENGPYHFNNLDIDKIYEFYLLQMQDVPKTRRPVTFASARRLTYPEQQDQPSTSHRLINSFNNLNFGEGRPEF
jgi:hypothetical protein